MVTRAIGYLAALFLALAAVYSVAGAAEREQGHCGQASSCQQFCDAVPRDVAQIPLLVLERMPVATRLPMHFEAFGIDGAVIERPPPRRSRPTYLEFHRFLL